MTQLSPRQARFVTEYLKSDNATQAAIAAGYGAANADVTAARLLQRRQVREALDTAKGDLFALFRQEAYANLKTLVAIRDDPEAPASVRLRAAQDLLDRAGYKPTDHVETTTAVAFTQEQNTTEMNTLLEALGFQPLGAMPENAEGDPSRKSES